MGIKQLTTLSVVTIAMQISCAYAGPCSPELDSMQARINAALAARAAAGPSAQEGGGALAHRQPTPKSVGEAEAKLGEVPPETAAAVLQAMQRARAADSAGDKSACEQAIAEAQRLIGSPGAKPPPNPPP